jgi:hypothetical protein
VVAKFRQCAPSVIVKAKVRTSLYKVPRYLFSNRHFRRALEKQKKKKPKSVCRIMVLEALEGIRGDCLCVFG